MCRAYTPPPESICGVLFFNYVAAFICSIYSPNAFGSLLRPAGSVNARRTRRGFTYPKV